MSLDKNIKLSSKTTIADYEMMLQEQNEDTKKTNIADFVFQRLSERYLLPLENVPLEYKNGFSIIANACLLIETYESFRQGWDDTTAPNRIPFQSFIDREVRFEDFKNHSRDFYLNVRCGILHQGETKNGWKITRKASYPIFTETEKRVNANKFLEALRKVLENYTNLLKTSSWNDEVWEKCRKKINFIINNCNE
jgi:hypothetical protein